MVVKDSRFVTPPWNTSIWRYMSLEKFLDIILNKQLFFSSAEEMSDKNEGTIPFGNYEKMLKELQGKELGDMKAKLQIIQYESEFKILKSSTYINCWIKNRYESYALWKIYLGGSKCGVAIKTNIKRLIDSINNIEAPSQLDIFVGDVQYTNYVPEPLEIGKLITTKGVYYKFENEVRLIMIDNFLSNDFKSLNLHKRTGIGIPIDPKALIDTIYLSPFTGRVFQDVVKKTIGRIDSDYLTRITISEIRNS